MDRYDTIGQGYSQTRREDPRFRALWFDARGRESHGRNMGALPIAQGKTISFQAPKRTVVKPLRVKPGNSTAVRIAWGRISNRVRVPTEKLGIMTQTYSGGCQCGKVRYEVSTPTFPSGGPGCAYGMTE